MENMKHIIIILISLLTVCFPAHAQSALEQALEMAGNVNISIPPASPPACAYCGHPLREGVGHYPGCSYYPRSESSSSTSSSSRDEDYYNTGTAQYRQEPEHVIYVPPTPIRDTPEGRAMLGVAEELGYAMGSMLAEGLRDLFSWGWDKIYDSTHKEYHGLGHGRQNGPYAVVQKNGKWGVWDNNRHRWHAKPAFSSITVTCLEAAPAQDAKTGKWGLYNVKEKKEVVPFMFDECKYFPEGGAKDPVALGYKDAGGNMHWKLGSWSNVDEYGFVKGTGGTYGQSWFDFWDGEYSSVELTHTGRGDLALLVKDYQSGKSAVRTAGGGRFFSWTENGEESFEEIQLTGMSANRYNKNGEVEYYNDFYIVGNNGKKGYAYAVSKPDHKRVIAAYQLLPCDYEEITVVRSLVPEGLKLSSVFNDMDGYNYLLVRKNGRYGLGATYNESVKNPCYLSCILSACRDEKNNRRHFFVVQREDGVYEALSPTGGNMYYKEGNTRVTGQSFAETVRKAEEYMRQPELRSSHASVFGI